LERLQDAGGGGRGLDGVAFALEQEPERLEDVDLVVGDEDAGGGRRGHSGSSLQRLPRAGPRAHSQRRAVMGSTRLARQMGSRLAARATTNRSSAAEANVAGSKAVTPTSRLRTKLDKASDRARPAATPASTSRRPCPSTSP